MIVPLGTPESDALRMMVGDVAARAVMRLGGGDAPKVDAVLIYRPDGRVGIAVATQEEVPSGRG